MHAGGITSVDKSLSSYLDVSSVLCIIEHFMVNRKRSNNQSEIILEMIRLHIESLKQNHH